MQFDFPSKSSETEKRKPVTRFDTFFRDFFGLFFQKKKLQNLNQYFQGLFHPARRVRECYWRIYNNLYLGAQVNITSIHLFFKMEYYQE